MGLVPANWRGRLESLRKPLGSCCTASDLRCRKKTVVSLVARLKLMRPTSAAKRATFTRVNGPKERELVWSEKLPFSDFLSEILLAMALRRFATRLRTVRAFVILTLTFAPTSRRVRKYSRTAILLTTSWLTSMFIK